jgi:hypothetical protein
MIRHNDPGGQAITFAIEMEQRRLNDIRNPRISQVTLAGASIQVRFNSV